MIMLFMILPAVASFQVLSGAPRLFSCSSSLNMVAMEMDDANRPPPAMPALAGEWGCDEATWSAVKNKRSLIKIVETGDADHFKKRLASIKELIANPPPPKRGPPAAKSGGRKKGGKQQTMQRKEGPYELYGGLPDALDAAAITARVNERADAKVAKNYALADSIREELATQGVRIRDDFRTWSYKNPATAKPKMHDE